MFVVGCVGNGLCDWLVIRLEESYRVCVFLYECEIMRDVETST